jgi:iron(III) transport system ATP-binding protein
MSTVTLRAVRKSLGGNPVVRGLDLDVAAGELVALLGPSGCGKTTTLRMVAGLEHADAGEITIAGERVDGPGVRLPPEHRRVSMVFQSYAVWPHRSVEENVAYPLERQGIARAERARRVGEALELMRLGEFKTRMPSALSGGQLQRVALARAVVAQPKVLLLDEPLSNLDAALKEELRAELAALKARLGTTMLYVTHDQAEALALADRVAVMNLGVIEQLATPQVLWNQPATAFVARFVGGANVLEGRASGGVLELGAARLALPPDVAADGAAKLAVRAEDVGVEPDPAGHATVKSALFLGGHVELRLELDGKDFKVLVQTTGSPVPGARVKLTIRRAWRF